MLQFFEEFNSIDKIKNIKVFKSLKDTKLFDWDSYIKLFKKNKTNLLALDIGSSSIKVLEIGKNSQGLTLEKLAILPLPDNALSQHQVKSYSCVTEILAKYVQENNYEQHDAALLLSGPQVITQILNVPTDLADHQLVTHIELEAAKCLPFNIDELAIDFDVLDSGESEDDFIKVLLAAAKKDFVEEYINLIKAADLNLRVIDVYSCVMGRLSKNVVSKQIETDVKDKVIAMLDLGQEVITLSIFKNEHQIYLKEHDSGGRNLTNQIMQEHSLGFEQAECLKLKYEDPMISIIIDKYSQQLSRQVYQMLQFFYSSVFADKIDYLFLVGGMAKLPNLDKIIQNRVELITHVLDPFVGINTDKYNDKVNFSEIDTSFSAVLGLAIRSYVE